MFLVGADKVSKLPDVDWTIVGADLWI